MHLDEAAGKASILGGLSASGWHTCAIFMRLLCDAFLLNSTSQGAPGVDRIKWKKPVLAGDPLNGRTTVLSRRESKSRPSIGLVAFRSELFNQRGEPVFELENTVMFLKREALCMTLDEFFEIDVVTQLGSHTFDAEGIKAFARKYDPQLFPHRRGSGEEKRLRRALRIRLADGRDLDEAATSATPGELEQDRVRPCVRPLARHQQPEMAEAGLCRRDGELQPHRALASADGLAAGLADADAFAPRASIRPAPRSSSSTAPCW